jgi:hypothetical protein
MPAMIVLATWLINAGVAFSETMYTIDNAIPPIHSHNIEGDIPSLWPCLTDRYACGTLQIISIADPTHPAIDGKSVISPLLMLREQQALQLLVPGPEQRTASMLLKPATPRTQLQPTLVLDSS